MTARPSTLILGWGNPGRGDDGLGPALAQMFAEFRTEHGSTGLDVSLDYQLQIEDAAEIAGHERVVFVDADRAGPEPFSCRRLSPSEAGLSFTSHGVSPGAVLALAAKLFDRQPEAWLMGIRGYDFDAFDETLSERARANLAAAASFLEGAFRTGRLEEFPARSSEMEGLDGAVARAEET